MALLRSKPENNPADHWSKDYVEHLRTVHFALIAACAALLVLLLTSKTYNSTAALRQVEGIQQLRRDWLVEISSYFGQGPDNWNWPSDQRRGSSPWKPPWKPLSECLYFKEKNALYHLRGYDPKEGLVAVGRSWPRGGTRQDDVYAFYSSQEQPPDDVARFSHWWDALARDPLFIVKFYSISTKNLTCIPQPKLLEAVTDIDISDARCTRSGFAYSCDYLHGPESWTRRKDVELTLYAQAEGFVDQHSLLKEYVDWKKGDFETAFADLDGAARQLGSLQLNDLVKGLQADETKVEVVEAFGIKFPVSEIAGWGLSILFAVQVYLLSYLRRLSRKSLRSDDPAWDVPWIGMDTSLLGRTILFLTWVVGPVLCALFVVARLLSTLLVGTFNNTWHFWRWTWVPRNPYHTFEAVGLVGVLAMNICFAVLSWKYRPIVGDTDSGTAKHLSK